MFVADDISVYARCLLKCDGGPSGLTTELMLKSGVVAVMPVRRGRVRTSREDPLVFSVGALSGGVALDIIREEERTP